MRILTVCTANQCRSVLAAAALRHAFHEAGKPAEVTSAGVQADPGVPATSAVRSTLAWRGWPGAQGHAARHIVDVPAGSVDIVLTAERVHLVPVLERLAVPRHRAYTLVELSNLVVEVPAFGGEVLEDYLLRLSASRPLTAFLGVGASPFDLADPTGRGKRAHRKTLAEIERHATAIAAALPRQWPPDPPIP